MNEQFLREFVSIFKKLDGREVSYRRFVGTAATEQEFREFELFLKRYDTDESLCFEPTERTRTLEFDLPKGFFPSLEFILNQSDLRRKIPFDFFYIKNIDEFYSSLATIHHNSLQNYINATKLFQMLEEKADHVITGSKFQLVFLSGTKLLVNDFYGIDDLCQLSQLSSFNLEFIVNDLHKDQKNNILKKSLVHVFESLNEISFSQILLNFIKIFEESKKGYELYLSEFSFEKVKKEIEKEKFDFIVKLNKVFSDIQGQLIGIPISLVLAGGQMKPTHQFDLSNFIIWLGALFYAAMMSMLIDNQRQTLLAIQSEYQGQWELIQTKHQGVEQRFKPSFDQLGRRYNHQRKLLCIVEFAVAIALAFISVLFVFYIDF